MNPQQPLNQLADQVKKTIAGHARVQARTSVFQGPLENLTMRELLKEKGLGYHQALLEMLDEMPNSLQPL